MLKNIVQKGKKVAGWFIGPKYPAGCSTGPGPIFQTILEQRLPNSDYLATP
jgi:hypothetical protein